MGIGWLLHKLIFHCRDHCHGESSVVVALARNGGRSMRELSEQSMSLSNGNDKCGAMHPP